MRLKPYIDMIHFSLKSYQVIFLPSLNYLEGRFYKSRRSVTPLFRGSHTIILHLQNPLQYILSNGRKTRLLFLITGTAIAVAIAFAITVALTIAISLAIAVAISIAIAAVRAGGIIENE